MIPSLNNIAPKISVIIRTYNRADLIRRAIQSVLSQSFYDFEIVVADDGSTDNTEQIVSDLAAHDSRIKFITQDHFGKPGRTLNLGLQNCHGEYIAMLDSDDEWLPSKLEKQVHLLESCPPHIGFVLSNTILVYPDGSSEYRKLSNTDSFLESILIKGYLFPSSMLAKKEVFDAIGSIDETYNITDDWDMFIMMSQKYDYNFVDEFLYKYYVHGNNISYIKNSIQRVIDLEYLLNKHLELYKKHPKILEHQYLTLVSYVVSLGDMKKARTYLRKSLDLNHSFKNSARFAISYLGKTVYQQLIK